MLINKRIAVSFLMIVAALTAVVGVTLAAFTDSVSVTENTLSTGDVSLNIASLSSAAGSCTGFGDSIGGVVSTGIVPGGSGSKYFCLRNISSTSGVILDVNATADITNDLDADYLDKSLVSVVVKCIGPEADTATLDAPGGEVPVVLDQVASGSIVTVTKAATVGASTAKCKITQTLSASAGDEAKSKTIKYDISFTGTQVAAP